MKKYIGYLLLAGLTLTTVSCNDDDLDSNSIFNTTPPARNEFDNWLLTNYVAPYNRSKIQMGRYREQSDIRLGSSRNEGIHQIG